MSLFRDSLGPPPLASDEAERRYFEAIRAEIEPDPLFRRRLRSIVVNRFVAVHEGLEHPVRRLSVMGRLARACLYASVALAASVGGVMAASGAAVPGDLLYPVKLQVEEIRERALPAHLHDELALYSLTERINELGRLVERGDVEHAAALVGPIGDGYDQLSALDAGAPQSGMLESRLQVLATLLERLPPQAMAAVERATSNASGPNGLAPPGWSVGLGNKTGKGNAGAQGAAKGGGLPASGPVKGIGADEGTGLQKDQRPADPKASETAEPSPKGKPSPTATETPSPEPSPPPSPGSRGRNPGAGGPQANPSD